MQKIKSKLNAKLNAKEIMCKKVKINKKARGAISPLPFAF